MPYISVLGHQTWASTGTDKDQTAVLLHGGLSNSDLMLDTIGGPLAQTYRVAAFDRRGHGRTADTSEPFHYAAMADETIAFLEHLGGPAHLIGWSDGGNVGLLVALRRPDLVGRLVTIGSNYHPDGLRPMTLDPDSPAVALLNAQYSERSPDGPEHFGEVVGKSLTMFASEPQLTVDDLRQVSVPVLVMVGDDDLIHLSHTCSLYESIPGAQLAVVPGASHALPMEQPEETARIIEHFLAADLPPATLMPSRRTS
ncbi:MAG: alpha/beta hydrolase [Actinomycetota bacterium]|nr:alpha/beta hydrolase [Actinomycetota bacterium]